MPEANNHLKDQFISALQDDDDSSCVYELIKVVNTNQIWQFR